MSPFQFEEWYDAGETIPTDHDMNFTNISDEDWDGITCIVCHDQHSLELAVACHSGHHTQYEDWSGSGHADTFEFNETDNTYCAKCMSPFQMDPDATHDDNDPIDEDNWTGINCMVCHNPHSLELQFYNGTAYEDPVTNPADLCGRCHGSHQYDEWNGSAHAQTNHGYNANTYCAKCMSPYQFDEDATHDESDPITSANWTGINCIVCHDQHTLELALFNGTER
jgi:hypothetical protein